MNRYPTPRAPSLTSRTTIFAYGVLCYAIGLTGLLALIARSLDLLPVTGGPLGTLESPWAWTVDVLLILSFGIQHAVMARPRFKRWWTRIIPSAAERSTFVLLAGLLCGSIVWLWQPMPELLWSVSDPIFATGLTALAVAGWTYMLIASFAIDHFHLFGLRQVWDHLRGRSTSETVFVRRLQYRFDRHPIMSGVMIGLWATPEMTVDRLALAVGLTLYIIVGVAIEERGLVQEHGESYRRYRREVGSLVVPLPGRDRGQRSISANADSA